MPSRTRTRIENYGGIRIHNGTHAVDGSYTRSMDDSATDVTGGFGDNYAISFSKRWKSGGQILGKQSSTLVGYDWQGYVCTWQRASDGGLDHLTLPTRLSNSQYALNVIERTNPSRASIDAMTNLAEIREIPSLIKEAFELGMRDVYRAFPKALYRTFSRVAKLNIMYQFGVAPLLSDLRKCLEFQALVDARVDELERMMSKRGLRRTIVLQNDSAASTTSSKVSMHSQGVSLDAYVTKHTMRKITGHIRWHPYSNFIRADRDIRKDALKVVSGNTVDFVTVYNLLPWSWLIDYFTNLGQFVSAGRNTVEAYHDPVRIMDKLTTIVSTPGDKSGPVVMTPILNSLDSYSRAIATPSLSARLTFLTERQTSILGSLAVLKGPRLGR